MAGMVRFNRSYADYGDQVRQFEKTIQIGDVITEFLWYGGSPYYSANQLINSKISSVWLGEGERPDNDPNNLDLIFRMDPLSPDSWTDFEVILRNNGNPVYGGFFFGAEIFVTDVIVAGHRAVDGIFGNERYRFEFDPATSQYRNVFLAAEGFARTREAFGNNSKKSRRRR